MRRRLTLVLLLTALGALGPAAAGASALPPVRHVFVIVLENESYATTFGPGSSAPYLAHELTARGQLLTNYYATGHTSLDNYISMISGQGPNPYTQADAPAYTDFTPGTPGADGQAMGAGSVYPASVLTLSDQLEARGLTWKGYMEDMGNSTTQPHNCRHPSINTPDSTQSARAGDQYAARHNPFVYFHSITDDVARCAAHDVPLDPLATDLRSAATTPNYSFIEPNLCHDGHDSPCVDGQPGGLVSADAFLRQWVPQILASPAYQADGLLAVIFDEAATSDSSACCGERAANTPNPGGTGQGPGGGRVGGVLISRYVAPGSVNQTPYNHYSMLRSIEDLFGLSHLGYAGVDGLKAFGDDVFNARPATTPTKPRPAGRTPAACTTTRVPRPRRGRFPAGTLIRAVRLGGRSRRVLTVVMAHAADLHVAVTGGGRTRRLTVRRVRACRSYGLVLARRPARVVVTATLRGGAERRVLR